MRSTYIKLHGNPITPEESADDGHVLPISNNMFQRYDVLSSASFTCLFYVIREYPNKPGERCEF
jgi:hypothetical protein